MCTQKVQPFDFWKVQSYLSGSLLSGIKSIICCMILGWRKEQEVDRHVLMVLPLSFSNYGWGRGDRIAQNMEQE